MQYTSQQHFRTTPPDQAAKKFNLIRRKVYSSSDLQFRIASYQAILVKYNIWCYAKLAEFQASLPEER